MRKVIEYANPPLYQPAAIAVAVTDFSLLFLSFLCMVSISKKSLYYVCITLTGRKEAFIRKYYDLGENFVVIENLGLSLG